MTEATARAMHVATEFERRPEYGVKVYKEIENSARGPNGELPKWHTSAHKERFWQLLMLGNVLINLTVRPGIAGKKQSARSKAEFLLK